MAYYMYYSFSAFFLFKNICTYILLDILPISALPNIETFKLTQNKGGERHILIVKKGEREKVR